MSNFILKVSNLSISNESKQVIDDISFEIKDQSINAILCPNNCGKTTLIKTLSGIIDQNDGEILIDDMVLNKKNFKECILKISTVLEDVDNQFICDNVLDEIKYPLINLKCKKSTIEERVEDISTTLKIKSLLDDDINKLKLYDKIKVLLAASIIHKPKLLFLDDIFRFLNNREKKDMLSLIKTINEKYEIAILFTTSNLEDVIDLDNIFVINDGKIIMHDSFENIIISDNELSKIGIEIPLMIDLSRKLQFYKLIDSIYYDPDKVVDKLWN